MISERILTAGDSLSAIAAEVYGEVGSFRDIADANDIDIFEVLPVGKSIVIPALADVQKSIKQAATQAASTVDGLDLSKLKQPETGNPWQLLSWVI